MGLLDVKDLKKEFNGEVLFDNINFTVNPKDKLALIGINGCGKTTLLKIILKQIYADGGSVFYSNQVSIGYLSQMMMTGLLPKEYVDFALSKRK